MTEETFRALLLEQHDQQTTATIRQLPITDLPAGEVLIHISYSSLNYKDGLAVTGSGRIVRSFPMIPGIDLVGTVRESQSPDYQAGDQVILTGWGVGERYWGGYAELARVPAAWLVPLPKGLSPVSAMALGTAGLTAMLCLMALEAHEVRPSEREVLVTGASGGVGSIALLLLAAHGYRAVASTGRTENHAYLRSLGAQDILERSSLTAPGKPLESERWAGVIDTVGGDTLAGALRALAYGGSVAACGNAGGVALNTNVFPFILRGVNLLGIDSVLCPFERRRIAWERLASQLDQQQLLQIATIAPLAEVPALSQAIVAGDIRGRVVIDVRA